jgi:hypothetical protein
MITLTTSGGAGTGAVTFSVSPSTTCAISGSTLVAKSSATCTVTATKSASSGYSASTSSPVSFVYAQKPLVITNTSLKHPAGAPVMLKYSGGPEGSQVLFKSVGNCIFSYTIYPMLGDAYLYGNEGSCDVTATDSGWGGYPSSTSTPIKFEFYKLDPTPLGIVTTISGGISAPANQPYGINQSITFVVSGGRSLYGGAQSHDGAINYSVTGKSCVTRTYVTGSGLNTAFTASEPTTCVVTATKAASLGYNETTSPAVSFVFVEFTAEPFAVRGAQNAGGGGKGLLKTSGGPPNVLSTFSITGANCSLNGSELIASTPTTCVVTASKAASVGYRAVISAPVEVVFKVMDQVPLVLTDVGTSNVVNKAVTLSTTGGSGSGALSYAVNGASCSISGGKLIASSPTTCVVTATKASSVFYNSTQSASLSIVFAP